MRGLRKVFEEETEFLFCTGAEGPGAQSTLQSLFFQAISLTHCHRSNLVLGKAFPSRMLATWPTSAFRLPVSQFPSSPQFPDLVIELWELVATETRICPLGRKAQRSPRTGGGQF